MTGNSSPFSYLREMRDDELDSLIINHSDLQFTMAAIALGKQESELTEREKRALKFADTMSQFRVTRAVQL